MQLTNQQTLPVGQAQAWEALNDMSLLQASIPGCESITPTGENQYEALVTASVGPVKAKFKGKLRLENIQAPNGYTLQFEGQGGAAGHGKGSAEIKLEAQGPNQTVLRYTANASVGGKLAQIGSRLVDMAAQKMATRLFRALQREAGGTLWRGASGGSGGGRSRGRWRAGARIVAWFKRLFGG